jgi:hypothetical protein
MWFVFTKTQAVEVLMSRFKVGRGSDMYGRRSGT